VTGCSCYFMHCSLKKRLTSLRCEYLATGKYAYFTPRQTELEYVQSLIQTSFEEMISCLRIPEQNVPLDMERFEQTKNRAICRRCAFQELCDRG
jgi:hypothetical protein